MSQPTIITNPKFKAGDKVIIKSRNGPHMLVESIRVGDPGVINLVWFDRKGRLRRDVLDDFNLVLVPED